MDRRIVLAGMAAIAAAPTLAYGQGNAAGAGKADAEHMERTMKTGALALVTSRIANQKAQHPRVKQFAQFEIAEQETMADILKSMQNASAAPSGDVKAPADAEVRGQLDAKGKDMVTKLEQASAGDFDREYVRGQVQGHRELLDAQEDYLKAGKNLASVNLAKLARTQIKEHIAMLQDIEKELGRKS